MYGQNPLEQLMELTLAAGFIHDYYDRRMVENIPNIKMAEDYKKVKAIVFDIYKKVDELKAIIEGEKNG